MQIRVCIIDDHPLVASGIAALLKDVENISMHEAYASVKTAMEGLGMHQPDVLLLDIQMPEKNGDELLKEIKTLYPHIRVLILTGFNNPLYCNRLIAAGANGYLLKNTDRENLITAIETIFYGERYIDPALAAHYKRYVAAAPVMQKISEREKEVLQLIAQEYTSEQIAAQLFISQRTVENHRFHLLQKLNVKNTVGLMRKAIELGLA